MRQPAAGCERDGYETYKEEEIRAYFQRRIRGKLILFSDVQEEVEVTRREVTVYCTGTKKRMKVSVKASAVRTEPEAFIRKIRKIQKAGEKLGETK